MVVVALVLLFVLLVVLVVVTRCNYILVLLVCGWLVAGWSWYRLPIRRPNSCRLPHRCCSRQARSQSRGCPPKALPQASAERCVVVVAVVVLLVLLVVLVVVTRCDDILVLLVCGWLVAGWSWYRLPTWRPNSCRLPHRCCSRQARSQSHDCPP